MALVPDMVGMVVDNMAAALAFYRLLGLPIPDGIDDEPFVEVKVNGYRLSWNARSMVEGFDPNWTPASGGSGRVSLAFLCESPSEVDTVYQRVVDAGHSSHKAPWDAFWGQRYASVADPDGNVIDLFAPLGG